MIALLLACASPSTTADTGPTDTDTGTVDAGPAEFQFAFAAVADPHVTAAGDHLDRLIAAVQHIEEEVATREIDFVVVLGDIAWYDGYDYVNEAMSELTVPWVPILGDNPIHVGEEEAFHDAFTPVYDQLATQLDDWNRAEIPVYNPEYGTTSWLQNFSWNHGGVHFAGLDWNSRSDDGFLGETADLHDFDGGTWEFFDADLSAWHTACESAASTSSRCPDESVVMFTHMPMFMGPGGFQVDEMAQVGALTLAWEHEISANFAGHLHGTGEQYIDDGGYDAYITDATWDDDNTVRFVEVWSNGVTFSYEHDLVEVGDW